VSLINVPSHIPDNDKLKKYIENTKVHNKLSNNESEKCEREITIEECKNAIFKMKNKQYHTVRTVLIS
jgi:hypothetical protein